MHNISGEQPSSSISNTKLLLRLKEDELNRKTLEAKELASQLYDDKQTIAILEDRLRDLNFNLHQKNTELASIKTMAAVRSDGQDREVSELNEKVCEIIVRQKSFSIYPGFKIRIHRTAFIFYILV